MNHKHVTLYQIVMLSLVAVCMAIVMLASRPAEQEPVFRNANKPATNAQPEKITISRPEIDTELESLISKWAEQQSGRFAVVVEELDGKLRKARYNADEQFVSASTYKLFYVFAVLHKLEVEQLPLTTTVENGMSVAACIDSLLTYSWDLCGLPFARFVGMNELDSLLIDYGFLDTDVTNYASDGSFAGNKFTTASDEALFMKKLYIGELLTPKNRELILDTLKNQKWRERIPAGVPQDVEVADKPGWIFDYENDVAIVYGETSTYVLVILSEGSTKPALAELSELIYAYLQ